MSRIGGVVALVGATAAELVWQVVTPVVEGTPAADQVAAAAAHPGRMQVSVWLDLLLLLAIPSALYIGAVAGGRSSRLATVGASLAFVTALGAGYILATDLMVAEVARGGGGPEQAAAIDAFQFGTISTVLLVAYLAGHLVGYVLLAVALFRARAIPTWAAAALGLAPIVQIAGDAAGIGAVSTVADALALVGAVACALVWARRTASDDGILPATRTSVTATS